MFRKVNEVSKKNEENDIFLTFDLDWASDDVVSFTIDIIEEFNIKATLFLTHETKLIAKIINNPNIEIGIHPNFNPLLEGDFVYGKNYKEVLKYYHTIFPDAVSVRSHSMTQSTRILDAFVQSSLKFDCNHFIPFSTKMNLKSWKYWNGDLIKVPYFWEDDLHCIYNWDWDKNIYLNSKGLKVFDFHPIHIFLNTNNFDQYKISGKYRNNYNQLKKCINKDTYGIQNFLIDLIESCL